MLIEEAPDFTRPLDLLAACHGRILKQCDTLEKLSAHLSVHGCDSAAQQAAAAVLRYFDLAAPLHHDDEERNLLPLLEISASSGESGMNLCDFVELLTAEHDEAALLWRQLRPALAAVSEGHSSVLPSSLMSRFIQLERHHVAFENDRLLPLAMQLLSADDQERLGRAMAARRGVAYPDSVA